MEDEIRDLDVKNKPSDFGLPSDFDIDGLCTQVKQQYDRGYTATQGLRTQFEQEDAQFNDQSEVRDRIVDYSFFKVHSALMARTYIDKPKITWDNIGTGVDAMIAKNLNSAWKTDMETPEWAKIEYDKDYNKYKFGAGIVVRSGWDGYNKRSTFTCVDPMLLIPDPEGDYIAGNYKFIGFEIEKFKEEITDKYQNIDTLTPQQTELTMKKNQLKTNSGVKNEWRDDRLVLYAHFCYFDGKLTYSVWGNERNTPLFIKVIEAKLPDEMEEKFVPISRFVQIDNWKPKKNSIFGHRLAILCLNVQVAKSYIATLRYQKAKAELFPMYIANTRMIQDRTDLDFGFNKVIFANPLEGESLGNVIQPVQKDFRADNSFLIDKDLDSQLTGVTGGLAGNLVTGDETNRRETLGTNQLQQGNADINLSMTTKISTWFYQNLAWGWYRGYIENFETADKKIVELHTGFGTTYLTLTKKDLLERVSLNVKVESYFEVKKAKEETFLRLSQLNGQTAGIEMPEISRKYLIRDIAEAGGTDMAKIDTYLGPTPQEQYALNENITLSKGEFVPINPEDEDQTHIITHKNKGIESAAMEVHIQSHVQAYIAKGANQMPVEGEQQPMPGMSPADQQGKKLQQSMAGQSLQNQVASSNGQLGGMM